MTSSSLGNNTATQIGVVVADIESSVKAWSLVLGVEPPAIIITDPVESAHTVYQGKPSPARAKLAFFHLGQVDLELIQPLGEPSTWNDQLKAHGSSLHHIAFEIKGMDEHIHGLEANGLQLVQRGDYTGGRYAYVDGQKEFGAVIELLEND